MANQPLRAVVIETGWAGEGIESMRQAFHPQASMFGYKGQDLFVTPIQGIYDYIAGTTPPAKAGAIGEQYTCIITSISVVGHAAAVEMAMDGYHEHDFTDYFQLLKIDGDGGSSASSSMPTHKALRPIQNLNYPRRHTKTHER